jgi:hypothetical protein
VEVSKNRTGKILLHFVKVKGEVREKFVECKLHGKSVFHAKMFEHDELMVRG